MTLLIVANEAKGYDRKTNYVYNYRLSKRRPSKYINYLEQSLQNNELFPFYFRNRPDFTGEYALYSNSQIINITEDEEYYYITIKMGQNIGIIPRTTRTNQIHPYVRACLDNSGFHNIKTHQCPGIYYKSP